MHYSLVSSPVLGFDLVRLPAGDSVAEVLLRALACGPRDVEVFAARHDLDARARAWRTVRDVVRSAPTVSDVLDRVVDDLRGTEPDAEGPEAATERGVLRVLRGSTIADSEALVRLVHHDVLDWTWRSRSPEGPRLRDESAARAADVLADAAVSAYLGEQLPDAVRRTLVRPYLLASRDTAPLAQTPRELGPVLGGVTGVLRRLAGMGPADRACLRAVTDSHGSTSGDWAAAVHDASWAVHLSGRVRSAAEAQLLAVRAFRAGGLDAVDGANGVWNVVSGVVHAEVVADLLASDTRAELLRPWEAAFGGC